MHDRKELDQRKQGVKAMLPYAEEKLLAVLSQHAAELDPNSIARLRAIDYHPRVSGLPRIWRSLVRLMRRRQLPPR